MRIGGRAPRPPANEDRRSSPSSPFPGGLRGWLDGFTERRTGQSQVLSQVHPFAHSVLSLRRPRVAAVGGRLGIVTTFGLSRIAWAGANYGATQGAYMSRMSSDASRLRGQIGIAVFASLAVVLAGCGAPAPADLPSSTQDSATATSAVASTTTRSATTTSATPSSTPTVDTAAAAARESQRLIAEQSSQAAAAAQAEADRVAAEAAAAAQAEADRVAAEAAAAAQAEADRVAAEAAAAAQAEADRVAAEAAAAAQAEVDRQAAAQAESDRVAAAQAEAQRVAADAGASSSAYFANCTEARAAGAAPVLRGDPGYSSKLDRDGDGVGCES